MLKEKKVSSFSKEKGFTVIELMIAAALSLIVMSGIYSIYRSQQKSYLTQEQVTMMQQNLRVGMVIITDDIRMAGYVHPNITGVTAGITTANPTTLIFTVLKNKDDDPADVAANKVLETIKYFLDAGNFLKRTISDGTYTDTQVIADDIDALNFVYLDENGNETATLAEIQSIQVTMVARSGKADPDYINTKVYRNQKNPPETIYTPPANDHYRRRILSREIRCRNL